LFRAAFFQGHVPRFGLTATGGVSFAAIADGVVGFFEVGLVVQIFHERVDLTGGFLFSDAVAFLNLADELFAATGDYVHIVIGQLAPLFANFTFDLLPFTF
jgi:hypothetical protein